MKTLFLSSLFAVCGIAICTAQTDTGDVSKRIANKMAKKPDFVDTVFVYTLKPVTITSLRVFPKKNIQKKYDRLVYNVRKVYPYAHRAGIMLREEEAKMSGMDKGDRRSHMKQVERRLEDEFGPELKALNFTQGRILLKLIDRETGHTSYELVDDLRGSFRAWFYDGIAGLFGYDLKSDYDPKKNLEDMYIEEVVLMIETGELQPIGLAKRP